MRIGLNGGDPVRDEYLPYFRPEIGVLEIEEVIQTLRSGWITTGPKTKDFEILFSEYKDVRHAIAVSSCTAGLHLALEAVGVKEGDEVITSPYTFCATANVIEQMGAKTVLADIEEDTMNISPANIEERITDRTKAIIPVHFAGHSCDMDPIMEIARKYGIAVIEDAAHAVETEYKGRKIGTIGDITVFSFYATKNLCTAEGGMVTTENDEYAERMRVMSLHGISKDAWKRYGREGSWYYEVIDCGFKYNFTDIQASIGIHQLKKLESNNRKRKEIVDRYQEVFSNIPECTVPVEKEYTRHAWHIYPLRIDFTDMQCDRAEFMNALAAENIGASVHFIPVHMHPYYIDRYGFKKDDFNNAYRQYCSEISLPLFPGMNENDVNDVCLAVEKLIKFYRKNMSVIKKIDNRDLNLRDIKSRQYLDDHETLNRMKSYFSKEEFEEKLEKIRFRTSEIVLESISIYYEDEALDFISRSIDEYIDSLMQKA